MQESKEIKVFPSDGGMRIIGQLPRAKAKMLESRGILQRESDLVTGALVGYRVVGVESRKEDGE
jgi:hypothetical protein